MPGRRGSAGQRKKKGEGMRSRPVLLQGASAREEGAMVAGPASCALAAAAVEQGGRSWRLEFLRGGNGKLPRARGESSYL
jgi:hypothetical protein